MHGEDTKKHFYIWLIPLFALLFAALSEHESYQRAISKNGSLQAYLYAAANLGLYIAVIVSLAAEGTARLVRRLRK